MEQGRSEAEITPGFSASLTDSAIGLNCLQNATPHSPRLMARSRDTKTCPYLVRPSARHHYNHTAVIASSIMLCMASSCQKGLFDSEQTQEFVRIWKINEHLAET